MKNKLEHKLAKRIEEGTYRSLSSFSGIDFCSNDYLGFSKIEIIQNEIVQKGSTGSRLISGNSSAAEDCETFLADFFNTESALVFNSGYDANVGFFSAIPQKGDLVLYDEKIHASVRDGVRLSFAKSFSFKHNCLEDLEKRLQFPGDSKYVAIESLYSMDGDMSPIVPILDLCDKYDARLIVDEAHTSGIFGRKGKGIVHALNVESRIFARLITFGKAYGSHGAAILCEELTKKFLINYARSFIYTTAMPPDSYNRIRKIVSHSLLIEEQSKLMENIQFFRSELKHSNLVFQSETNSPIQLIKIGDIDSTVQLAKKILLGGFAIKAILSPTVAKGDEGLRICLHSFNTKDQIQLLVQLLIN